MLRCKKIPKFQIAPQKKNTVYFVSSGRGNELKILIQFRAYKI